jgi:hypothetical protein
MIFSQKVFHIWTQHIPPTASIIPLKTELIWQFLASSHGLQVPYNSSLAFSLVYHAED